MTSTIAVCGVCLQKPEDLRNTSDFDANNITLHTKLILCVPALSWPETLLICVQCIQRLEVSWSFRELCIKADEFRRNFSYRNESYEGTCADFKAGKREIEDIGEESVDSGGTSDCSCKNEDESNETVDSNEDGFVTAKEEFKDSESYFECSDCKTRFSERLEYQKHLKVEHNIPTPFTCVVCEKTFKTITVLKNHEKLHKTPFASSTRKKTAIKRAGRPCRYNSIIDTCELCPAKFTRMKDFTDHLVNIHKKDPKTFKPFRCLRCSNRYVHLSSLTTHLREHDNLYLNMCSFCGKEFKKRSDLHVHENIHLNRRSNRCDICDKGFNTYKTLRTHNIIKHQDPATWPHACAICGRRFPMKSNYDNHVRRHIGDKRFACHVCGKRFVTRAEVASHVTSHTNVRRFKCATCGKEYKEKRVYEVHLRSAHGIGDRKVPVRERKHECEYCKKGFYDRHKLKRHLCTHTGERPYRCGVCERTFSDRSYLRQHLKVAHEVKEEERLEKMSAVVG